MPLARASGPRAAVMHACTIVARNYLAQAQVLVDSYRRHHPDGTFEVLIIDEPGGPRPVVRGAETVMLDEIGIDPGDLTRMSVIYDLIELATAAKPWLLLHLLDRGHDHAIYFDPDISIERAIDELPGLARKHHVVLTPHLTEPMPRDGGTPDEQVIIQSGVYNLGFIAVGGTDEGRRMLRWWRTRLLEDCLVDMGRGFFTDQRWIDYVPSLFEHHIVKDPTWNAAYWNLATRPLSRGVDGEILICGRPRTFVHFSGYTPALPHLLSKHQGERPRLLLSDNELLRELCDDYGERLIAEGFLERQRDFRMPFTSYRGVPLDRMTRRLVRTELVRSSRGASSELDFDAQGLNLAEWLDTPVGTGGDTSRLTRYLAAVYAARPDLQIAYPGAPMGDTKGFYRWVEHFGVTELAIAPERLAAARRLEDDSVGSPMLSRREKPPRDTTPAQGVELAGYLSADLGLGETARQFVAGLVEAKVPVSTTTYRRTDSRLGTPWTDRLPPAGSRYDTSLICVNADQLPRFVADAGQRYLRGRYRIGLWFWELEDFPFEMLASLDQLDEIWVCSEFNRASIARHTDKPVRVVPHPAHAPAPSTARIAELEEDGFTFLFVFDYFSDYRRKNPAGLVEAFVRAFPEPGEARLVIKSINGEQRERDREDLRYRVAARSDIHLVERYLTRDELDGLMHSADCYVSLHRSEGFGQTLAETMAIGKPVVATGYSGNLEFTRSDNSLLVPFTMTQVGPGSEAYPAASQWAEPDLAEAARLMRRVFEDTELRERISAEARRVIAEEFSTHALGRALDAELARIWDSAIYQRRRTAKRPPQTQESRDGSPPPLEPSPARARWRGRRPDSGH